MRQIDSVRKSKRFEKALERAAKRLKGRDAGSALESMGEAAETQLDEALEKVHRGGSESIADEATQNFSSALEAIILADLRPAYFISNDKIEIDGDYDHVDLIKSKKTELEEICTRVGSVDILNHASMDYIGTGWLIEDNIVVTNRHVAELFTRPDWPSGWSFAPLGFRGRDLIVELNPGRQKKTGPPSRPTLFAEEILYVAGPREPDIALLKVRNTLGIGPIPLRTAALAEDAPVAAVGYPAADAHRNDPVLMDDIFGGEYQVKRFSPGLANGYSHGGVIMLSDYTTLGGNSGSAVISLECGKAAGLHFAGIFQETNFAVAADILAATLRSARSGVSLTGLEQLPDHAERRAPGHFEWREGYDPTFLGDGELQVDIPDLGARKYDVAPVSDADNGVLRYTHFSVIQSKSRRLPMLTAVNIDGEKAFPLKRKGDWHTDGRVHEDHQVDNVLYKYNPLDRGHMVRRKDPGWGDSRAEAQQGEIDTLMYTNCAPQHKDLNQKDWVGLEDYILRAADTKDFKVSVMTGPVFRDTDRRLRMQPGAEDIQIPEAFWKLAVMVNADTGKLSATAYVLTQGDLIKDLTEAAFVLGEYKTYQVKVSMLSEMTDFDFSHLAQFDPMRAEPEGLFGRSARLVDGMESLKLSPLNELQ